MSSTSSTNESHNGFHGRAFVKSCNLPLSSFVVNIWLRIVVLCFYLDFIRIKLHFRNYALVVSACRGKAVGIRNYHMHMVISTNAHHTIISINLQEFLFKSLTTIYRIKLLRSLYSLGTMYLLLVVLLEREVCSKTRQGVFTWETS